jgi:type II secretory pathway pseudopilin PulG
MTRILAMAVTVAVVAAVIAAVVILGPPGAQRERRLDAARISDLQMIQSAVMGYVARHEALPADLATLAKEPGYALSTSDPQTGAPYVYEVTGTTSYRLCASFTTDTAKERRDERPDYTYSVEWAHGAGRQCFERHAKKSD